MRQVAYRKMGFAALACALAGTGAGCRSAVTDFYDSLTSGGSGTGGTGGSGGLPSDCQGDPTKDPAIVRDDCGIFVDASVMTNGDGSKANPLKSLAAASAKDASRIFVCAGTYTETLTVQLVNGVEVYGGFGACPKSGDWTWDAAKRASVTGPANQPAVVISMGTSLVRSVDFTAPDATMAGASSIAMIVDSAEVTLTDVALTAGAGAKGADGMVPSDVGAPGVAGVAGTPSNACDSEPSPGQGGMIACTGGEASAGGSGGDGGTKPSNNGLPGTDGSPAPVPNDPPMGAGGTVNAATGACSAGGSGANGVDGKSGKGGSLKGVLTANGITGGDGEDGEGGHAGQGGGGGAGSKAGTFCTSGANTVPGIGASGGGGGSGGCGGPGGTGGKAGGSSIGIVSLSSHFTFTGAKITTAAGADGGKGAAGKTGGLGGTGGNGGLSSGINPSKPGCKGGDGGLGGGGGTGGGGRGGHSVGIAFLGDAPTVDKEIAITTAMPGLGGKGDSANMGDGAKGTAGPTVDFK